MQFTGNTWTADQELTWICVACIPEGHLFLSGKGNFPQSSATSLSCLSRLTALQQVWNKVWGHMPISAGISLPLFLSLSLDPLKPTYNSSFPSLFYPAVDNFLCVEPRKWIMCSLFPPSTFTTVLSKSLLYGRKSKWESDTWGGEITFALERRF